MDTIKRQMMTVERLAQHEETISALYALFSRQFIFHQQFWHILSLEELVHASWIRKLYPQVADKNVQFDTDRFALSGIEKSLTSIKKYIVRAKRKKISLRKALEIALTLEDSVIESRFFSIYKTDTKIIRQLLEALSQAYVEHRERLKKFLQELA
ncbi:MAG: hypothetical protein WCI77_08725 [Candidatus Omnitrophota bacterium]